MRIILSPTKKMRVDNDQIAHCDLPVFIDKTKILQQEISKLNYDQCKKLWKCNDKIADENFQRFAKMDLNSNLTPAILAYDGLVFRHISPTVFEQSMFDYVNENLRILSGFYGILRAFDGVVPYRLEMQAELSISPHKNLYDFWGESLYNQVYDGCDVVLNLASKEYYKCIEKFLKPTDKFVTCVFGEQIGEKIVQKATFAKMARGEMVRFMAQNNIKTLEQVKGFNVLGYEFNDELSSETEFVFIKKELPR